MGEEFIGGGNNINEYWIGNIIINLIIVVYEVFVEMVVRLNEF